MRWMKLALLFVPLNACIYYEGGECDDCGWDDWCTWDCDDDPVDIDDTGAVADDTGDDNVIVLDLSLTPSEAEQGAMLIGSLKSGGGEDLSGVSAVEFSASVSVNALQARAEEVILSLSVAADAEIGPVDLFLDFEDGTTAFGEAVFTILEATEPPDTGDDEDPC
ncbi:MAG: hypothetical protein JRJ84_18205 [Deltaproteobacteria bacterium]|nr:hypothetical protein [Deltaproteobacteria bacterium]